MKSRRAGSWAINVCLDLGTFNCRRQKSPVEAFTSNSFTVS